MITVRASCCCPAARSPGSSSTIFARPAARNVVNILNNASVLYLSALAAAIGFRMGLFNIGVEGQYRVGGLRAPPRSPAQDLLPGVLNILVAFVLAILAGAVWAAIAGLLKVTRGVSEVISTIMLNAIAVSLTAYLLRRWGVTVGNSLGRPGRCRRTAGSRASTSSPGAPNEIFGLALAGGRWPASAYSVVLNRSRFGFELRATGASADGRGRQRDRRTPDGGRLDGASPEASPALVGLPLLFGDTHSYSTTFQAGLGFSGIAVALLGRNHPVGIAFGALLFAYLTEQSSLLEINAGVSNDIVSITQGVLVLSVVVAYEVVRRYRRAQEQRSVAAAGSPAPVRGGVGMTRRQRRPRRRRRAGGTGAGRAGSRCGPGCWRRSC